MVQQLEHVIPGGQHYTAMVQPMKTLVIKLVHWVNMQTMEHVYLVQRAIQQPRHMRQAFLIV